MITTDGLVGLLRRIDNYSIGSFSERLILQKTIYLMQVFGLPLGYRFSWYFHGPYCPDLTRQLYEIREINERNEKRKFKSQDHEATFIRFIEFLGDKKKDRNWLEAVASLHYLKRDQLDSDNEIIIDKFLKLKPKYSRRAAEQILHDLESLNLT